MGARIDENLEIGNVYGDLQIIRFIKRQSGNRKYEAKCLVCGRTHEVWIKDVKKGVGITHKHCSWFLPKNNDTKRLRTIFKGIIDRCNNPNNEHYDVYGGRGITCQYVNFIDFYDDFYESYIEHKTLYGEKNTTIDRINPNGNYEKNNMRWATWEIQLQNKRWNTYIATKGNEVLRGTAKELSEKIQCNKGEISSVASGKHSSIYGWSIVLETSNDQSVCS